MSNRPTCPGRTGAASDPEADDPVRTDDDGFASEWSVLARLARRYAEQCDGEWEHFHGVEIDTLGNPGWTVQIETRGTRTPLPDVPEPAGWDIDAESADWMVHWVEDGTFRAYGDPTKLEPILRLFLDMVARGRH